MMSGRRTNALPMTLAEGLYEIENTRMTPCCGLVVISQRTGREYHRYHTVAPKSEDDDYTDNFRPTITMPSGG